MMAQLASVRHAMAPKRMGGQPKRFGPLLDPGDIVAAGTSIYVVAQFGGRLQRYSTCDGMLHPGILVEAPSGLDVMGDYVYLSEKGRIVRFAP